MPMGGRQIALALVLTLSVAVAPASAVSAATSRGTYLIVAPAALRAAADAWAAYRAAERWAVRIETAPADGTADERRRRVGEAIAARHAAHRSGEGGPFVVLLLGDADAIPPHRFEQTDPLLEDPRDPWYATDHPFQRSDRRDDLPDIALGRVPARTVPEAMTVLEKVRRYERSAPTGPWRRRISYAAGEGRFGGLDVLVELLFRGMLTRLVPDRFDPSLTYAKPGSVFCPPPEQLNDEMLRRLGEGSLLFNYLGHGEARHLDRLTVPGGELTLLHVEDLRRLPATGGRLPIALLTCCSAGWFDLPGDDRCLAEAMLLHPEGPVAVIAGSRPTHPYANAVLQKDVTELLLKRRVSTVGELDLLATRSMLQSDPVDRQLDLIAAPLAISGGWSTSLRGLRHMHARLYNLLGDPATRIAHPGSEMTDVRVVGPAVRGHTGALREGRVELTVESDLALAGLPALGEPARPAAEVYARVNDRVLLRVEGAVSDGRFDVTLPEPLPPGAAVVKAYAVGRDERGRPVDAFGAARLTGAAAAPGVR
jgi:hypothetical protein